MMPYTFVRLDVKDYAKWKSVFDESGSFRRESGSKGGSVFRNADNPKEVVILLEWDNLENAREFVQSDRLREGMERAGVDGKPNVYFIDEVDKPDA
jgi:heme-degrading monooxygenase HmoA